MNSTKMIARNSILIALAALLGYLEHMLPIAPDIPGVKLGLANLAAIVALYTLSASSACVVNISRVVIVNVMFGTFMSMMYGLTGGILSLSVMIAAKRRGGFGIVGVGILGGVAHNIGQISIAALIAQNAYLLYYLPILLAAGALAGGIVGFLSGIIIKRLNSIFKA